MFHHWLWYWRWSWGRLWLVVEFPAYRYTKSLLVVAQQSWHKSHRSVSHVQIVRQNALNGPIWQSYYLTYIMDSLPTICKITLRTFAMFSGVMLVVGHPERSSSSSSDVEVFYHKKVLLWLMALSPKASCSIRRVSAAVFFKIETKFDAESLLLKIGHISCKKKNRQITKT